MANNKTAPNPRLGTIGGQALIEGVMMKSRKDDLAMSVRRENGGIVTKTKKIVSLRNKYRIFNMPVIRGVVNFIEMMVLSMSTLTESAEMLGIEEELQEEIKKEKMAKAAASGKEYKEPDKKSASMTAVASVIGVVLGLGLSFFLFFYVPVMVGGLINDAIDGGMLRSLIEGVIRFGIFIVYILLVSLMKDIRRTFEYHGAEHMSVFCYESGDELTVENARKHSRFHPRCGTSFMIVMMLIGILISMLIPLSLSSIARIGVKLLIFPFIIGIGFEFIRFAGKHDNIIVRILAAPGIWMQLLTTKKPDDSQLEVALISLKLALPDEFPEFCEEMRIKRENENSENTENNKIAEVSNNNTAD